MRRKYEETTNTLRPADVASVNRIARRIEGYCRKQVPDCRVVTVVDSAAKSLDLRIGRRGGGRSEQLWVRDLDISAMADQRDVERLARLISVWIEPAEAVSPASRTSGSRPGVKSRVHSAVH